MDADRTWQVADLPPAARVAAPSPPAVRPVAPPPFRTRLLAPDDLPRAARLDGQLTGRGAALAIGSGTDPATPGATGGASIVAEAGGDIVGYLIVAVDAVSLGSFEPVAVVEVVGVRPDWRRRGVARGLFAALRERLLALGIERVRAELDWRETELLGLFARVGFAAAPRVCLEAGVDVLPASRH